MEPSYQYSPLSDHPKATRLIVLHPSANDDAPLPCEIKPALIGGRDPYVALSYTWGQPKPAEMESMIVVGERGERATFSLTPNCAAALRVLRNSELIQNRGLWVDAICINQSCNKDKDRQVAMMADVYREAEAVAIWLGSGFAPENFNLVEPFMGSWLEKICAWHSDAVGWWEFVMKRVKRYALQRAIKASDRIALSQMIEAPYWKRAWTLQESGHLSSVIICRDSKSCPVLVLWNALREHALLAARDHGLDLHFELFPKRGPAVPRSGLQLVRALLRTNAGDPRDKVYAFRKLLPESLGKVAPHYSRSIESTFSEATRKHITEHFDLSILYVATAHPTKLVDLPSWALDWAYDYLEGFDQIRGAPKFMIESSHASGSSQPLFEFSNDGARLFITGKQIAQVRSTAGELSPRSDRQLNAMHPYNPADFEKDLDSSFRILCNFILTENAANHRPRTAEERLEAFRRLVMWHVNSTPLMAFGRRILLNSVMFNKRDDVRTSLHRAGEDKEVKHIISEAMCGGMLFETADGRFGVGFCTLNPGDLVCIFVGLELPFIVRPSRSGFTLLCSAYVDGVMDGELWDKAENMASWEML